VLRRRLISSSDFNLEPSRQDPSPPSPSELSDQSSRSSTPISSDSFIGRSPSFEHRLFSRNSSRPTSAEPDERYRRFDDIRGRARRRSMSPGSSADRAYSRSRSNSVSPCNHCGYPSQGPAASHPPNLYANHVYNPHLYINHPVQPPMLTYGPGVPPLSHPSYVSMPSLAPASSASYYPRRYPVSAPVSQPVSHPGTYQPHINPPDPWMNPVGSSYSEYPRRW
jgi:hypothetical protein